MSSSAVDEGDDDDLLVVKVEHVPNGQPHAAAHATACVAVNARTTYEQLLLETAGQFRSADVLVSDNAELCVVSRRSAVPVVSLAELAHRNSVGLLAAVGSVVTTPDAADFGVLFGERIAVERYAADVDAALVVEDVRSASTHGFRVAHDTTVAELSTRIEDQLSPLRLAAAHSFLLADVDHARFDAVLCAPASPFDTDQYLIGRLCGLRVSSGALSQTSPRVTWLERLSRRPATASSRAAADVASPLLCARLCDAALNDKEPPTDAVWRCFAAAHRVPQLLHEALLLEVARTDDATTLLRGASVASRLLSTHARATGESFLRDVLQPVLGHILATVAAGGSFEVDPTKVSALLTTEAPKRPAPTPEWAAALKRVAPSSPEPVGSTESVVLESASERRKSLNVSQLHGSSRRASGGDSYDNWQAANAAAGSPGASGVSRTVVAAALDVAQRRLVDSSNRLIRAVLDSARLLPLSLRRACCIVHHCVASKFPEAAVGAVGAFMFLRFLMPAFVSPQQSGLHSRDLGDEERRAVVMVAKVMQHLVNGTRFGVGEPHMQPFNALLITPNEKSVRALLAGFADPLALAAAVAATSTPAEPAAGSQDDRPLLARLFDAVAAEPAPSRSSSAAEAAERVRDLYCVRDAVVAHYPALLAFAAADGRAEVLKRLVELRRGAERLRTWSRAFAVAGACVPVSDALSSSPQRQAKRTGFLRRTVSRTHSPPPSSALQAAVAAAKSGAASHIHAVAMLVTNDSKSGARLEPQIVATLGVANELWPTGASLPVQHECLLGVHAAGLRYIYGSEAESLEHANAYRSSHPQLSRELFDAIDDSGVITRLPSADSGGEVRSELVAALVLSEGPVGGGAGDKDSTQLRRHHDGPVFGRSLEHGCEWHGVRHATPVLLQRAVHYLNTHPDVLVTEGLFRVPGDAKLVASLRQRFDDGHDIDLASVAGVTVHVVASLLSMYLRQVRPPAIPSAFRARFVAYAQVPPAHQIDYMRVMLHLLPSANRRSLDLLCAFLQRLARHESATKMSVANLALVFGPCLVAASELAIEDPLALRAASEEANDVIVFIIEHHAELFLSDVNTDRLGPVQARVRDPYLPDADTGELSLRRKQPLFLLREVDAAGAARWRTTSTMSAAGATGDERKRVLLKSANSSVGPSSPLQPPLLFGASRGGSSSSLMQSMSSGEGGAASLDKDAVSADSSSDDDSSSNDFGSDRTSSSPSSDGAFLSPPMKARPTGRPGSAQGSPTRGGARGGGNSGSGGGGEKPSLLQRASTLLRRTSARGSPSGDESVVTAPSGAATLRRASDSETFFVALCETSGNVGLVKGSNVQKA